MGSYLVKRIITGLISVIIVVAIIMILIYSLLNRNLVFAADSQYTKQSNNQKITYTYSKWEEYGYLDYVPYGDWLTEITNNGEIDEDTRSSAASIGRTADADSDITAEYVQKFTEYYESKGYTVTRLDAVVGSRSNKVATGGAQQLFAYKDIPLYKRLLKYFGDMFDFDNIHKAESVEGKRGLTFTLHDPLYGGTKFSPAIIGNGTEHKYLLYFDSQFPFIHQNMLTIWLGTSYTVNSGVDVLTTMTQSQGEQMKVMMTFPTGLTEESSYDVHQATYSVDTLESSPIYQARYTDDYTVTPILRSGMSRIGFSFVIGIIAVILSYLLGVPLGIVMAMKKDKLLDKIGTIYIIFIIAVPSLAYIFIFKAIGGKLGLPTTFVVQGGWIYYVLPVISLALPSIANLMKWLRRYMIDQMNSDYVKFARSGGLTEGEIFSKHILKNAAIPIIQGVPASVLGALVGAIITERVYTVPGAGGLLVDAINKYDNAVIVGVALFYALLSVASLILGDVFMAAVDPRISFTSKGR